jgi:hypothetical protein
MNMSQIAECFSRCQPFIASAWNLFTLGELVETPWIKHPVALRGKNIELRPLEFETLDALFSVTQDPDIWRFTSVDYPVKENFYPNFNAALKGREGGKSYPFLVCLVDSSRIIGTTRLLEIVPEDRKKQRHAYAAPICPHLRRRPVGARHHNVP